MVFKKHKKASVFQQMETFFQELFNTVTLFKGGAVTLLQTT